MSVSCFKCKTKEEFDKDDCQQYGKIDVIVSNATTYPSIDSILEMVANAMSLTTGEIAGRNKGISNTPLNRNKDTIVSLLLRCKDGQEEC